MVSSTDKFKKKKKKKGLICSEDNSYNLQSKLLWIWVYFFETPCIICPGGKILALCQFSILVFSFQTDMDCLWNKRCLQKSSFHSDDSTDFDLAFPKANTHFCIYFRHKCIPWVAFVRKHTSHGRCWSPPKAQIEGPCTVVPSNSSEIERSLSWSVV